jgi:hypothetical protein
MIWGESQAILLGFLFCPKSKGVVSETPHNFHLYKQTSLSSEAFPVYGYLLGFLFCPKSKGVVSETLHKFPISAIYFLVLFCIAKKRTKKR